MKNWFVGIGIFILTYLFFMVSQIPAQWALNQMLLPSNVVLQGVKGSVWQGSINRVIVDGYSINNVDAGVNILPLLLFNLSVDGTFGGDLVNGPQGSASLNNLLGDIEVSKMQVSLPANDIAQQLPLPLPLTAQKFIDITIDQFVMGQPVCQQLNGNILWNNASIKALDEKITLGKLSGQLSCEKGVVKFTFDPKNNLGLTFDAYVYSPERISGKGFIKPGKQFPAILRDAIPFIGSADKNGQYPLNF